MNAKVFYELWLEQMKEENPGFVDDDPIRTQSDFIDALEEQPEEEIPMTEELENHMVIGDYYEEDEEDELW